MRYSIFVQSFRRSLCYLVTSHLDALAQSALPRVALGDARKLEQIQRRGDFRTSPEHEVALGCVEALCVGSTEICCRRRASLRWLLRAIRPRAVFAAIARESGLARGSLAPRRLSAFLSDAGRERSTFVCQRVPSPGFWVSASDVIATFSNPVLGAVLLV
jgi:hypothetical protein